MFVCLFVFEAVGEVTVSVGNVKALRLLEEHFHTCVLKFQSCDSVYSSVHCSGTAVQHSAAW